MKRRILVLLYFTMLILSTPVLGAYDVEYKCDDGICIEGDIVTFDVTLTTESLYASGMDIDNITYTQISIKDKLYDTVIARKSVYETLGPYDVKKITLTGINPPPTKGHDLYFVPCFEMFVQYHYYSTVTYEYVYRNEKRNTCGQDTLTMKVYPLSELECRNTDNCKEDESCIDFKCKKLLCEDAQGYKNHQCQELNCQFFQDTRNHNCETNYTLLGGGIFVLGLIIVVFIKNHHKIRKIRFVLFE